MSTEATTSKPKGLEVAGHGIYVSTLSNTVYETTRSVVEPGADTAHGRTTTDKWVRWGVDDNYPQRLIDAVKSDPVASLIAKKIAFHWGRGLMFYRKKKDPKTGIVKIEELDDTEVPDEIHEFFRVNEFEKQMMGFITDFEWWHSFTCQYVPSFTGKIVGVKWQKRKNIRPEWRNEDTGKIDNYYLSNFFGNGASINSNVVAIPAFDKNANHTGIYNHDLPSVDKDYNPDAEWHGITRWLNIASKIPRWILANIDNSINFKYHIKIPLDYILKMVPEEKYKTTAEWHKAIEVFENELYRKMDEYLAGEKNVHKAFYSKVAVDDLGKPLPGWEIIAIDNKIEHEAWLKAYGTAAMAMISGIGLAPSIAGSILPNGLGQGSGSDLREQFNFYIQVMTSIPREVTLEPWKIIKHRNGWPKDIHLGFRDVVLQTTDQNKSGFTKQGEESPTSDKQEKLAA